MIEATQLLESIPVQEQLRSLLRSGHVEEVVIDDPVAPGTIRELVNGVREAGRSLRLRASQEDLPASLQGERWRQVSPGHPPYWQLARRRPASSLLAIKRLLDIVVAGGLLLLSCPVMLAIAVAVRVSSPGPILYRWRVAGRFGRQFTGYKFRTMVQDADRLKASLLERNEMHGPVFKLTDDPRLTPIGRWLRRYSLDELPQLWSVLMGDMSLVGPRPPLWDEYQHFELWQVRKLSVTPGITCLWQVAGRNRISNFADWVKLDLAYIDHWSLGLDLRILLRTALAVLRGTGR